MSAPHTAVSAALVVPRERSLSNAQQKRRRDRVAVKTADAVAPAAPRAVTAGALQQIQAYKLKLEARQSYHDILVSAEEVPSNDGLRGLGVQEKRPYVPPRVRAPAPSVRVARKRRCSAANVPLSQPGNTNTRTVVCEPLSNDDDAAALFLTSSGCRGIQQRRCRLRGPKQTPHRPNHRSIRAPLASSHCRDPGCV